MNHQTDGMSLGVTRANEIKPSKVDFIFPNIISKGHLNLFSGDPGVGKTLLCMDLVAALTCGKSWPQRNREVTMQGVLVINNEDTFEDIIVPRLIGANADLSQVHLISHVDHLRGQRIDQYSFSVAKHIRLLDEKLSQHPEISLVLFDPLKSFLGRIDANNSIEVRNALMPLLSLARKHHVAIVGVEHLNKNSQTKALYRISGSLQFLAVARIVHIVVNHKDDPELKLLLTLKNNISPKVPGCSYRIQSRFNASIESEIPYIDWQDYGITMSVDEALNENSGENFSALEAAKEWLLSVFTHPDIKVNTVELKQQAIERDISWRTIERAKKELGITALRDGNQWIWSLRPPNYMG